MNEAAAGGGRIVTAPEDADLVDDRRCPEPHDGAAPGTIWVAIADASDFTHARGFVSRGERDRVRRWAEQAGLDLVRRHLEGVPLPGTSLPG